MMSEAKTSGIKNKHNTAAFYVGEMPIDMRANLERYELYLTLISKEAGLNMREQSNRIISGPLTVRPV